MRTIPEIQADIAKTESTQTGYNKQIVLDSRNAELISASIEGISPQTVCEVMTAYKEGRCIALPKEAHQPYFVQDDAKNIFDQWNDITGAIANNTSWYFEMQSVIEEVAAMAFGAGILYESKRARSEAEAALNNF